MIRRAPKFGAGSRRVSRLGDDARLIHYYHYRPHRRIHHEMIMPCFVDNIIFAPSEAFFMRCVDAAEESRTPVAARIGFGRAHTR